MMDFCVASIQASPSGRGEPLPVSLLFSRERERPSGEGPSRTIEVGAAHEMRLMHNLA